MEFIYLLDGTISHDNKEQPVVVESVINEQWDYTSNYRAIIGGSLITEFSIDENTLWFEKDKGHTPLAKELGNLVENYFE
jgi:hypothetical protein